MQSDYTHGPTFDEIVTWTSSNKQFVNYELDMNLSQDVSFTVDFSWNVVDKFMRLSFPNKLPFYVKKIEFPQDQSEIENFISSRYYYWRELACLNLGTDHPDVNMSLLKIDEDALKRDMLVIPAKVYKGQSSKRAVLKEKDIPLICSIRPVPETKFFNVVVRYPFSDAYIFEARGSTNFNSTDVELSSELQKIIKKYQSTIVHRAILNLDQHLERELEFESEVEVSWF